MIVVSTGTNGGPFDRLLRAVGELHVSEKVIVQHGPSTIRPLSAECVSYLSFNEYVELVARARVVVTHGGVGSVLVSLMQGFVPLVVPRLAAFGEAVDDHQLEFTRRMARTGAVIGVEDATELAAAVAAAPPRTAVRAMRGSSLGADLAGYLRELDLPVNPLNTFEALREAAAP